MAELPPGVKAVWDLSKAYREETSTRERVCINGLWRWQPAEEEADAPPDSSWGHFKVPGSWLGIGNYMQKDSQTVHAHPDWQRRNLSKIKTAWYEREVTVPREWTGGRMILHAEYVNSYAVVYIDGVRVGEIRFPWGEVDLTEVCVPGQTHVLSMFVLAMPLKGVMLSYNDTASSREVKGSVDRRGLCGDLFLVYRPSGPRIDDVRVNTSVRSWEITFEAGLVDLEPGASYALRAAVEDDGRGVAEFTSQPFTSADLEAGRFSFTEGWRPEKLWDIHTAENIYTLELSLLKGDGRAVDVAHTRRFGFREFWIEGRDFYLNGSRLFLSAVPLDNAQIGAALACYEGARESLERLKSTGINFVYTHNYGCEPGSHLGFSGILRAADDAGMLIALSQPHFGHYDWDEADADEANGYAHHAAFFASVAGNHPSVVAYSTSHNATGYSEDMNPYMIDGTGDPRSKWARKNVIKARRVEAIIKRLDPWRMVYHHSSGNLGPMHTSNFYPNFVPIQEMSDWFEHWATEGVKPVFLCEYGAPFMWDWTMYRGWYQGERSFGSAVVPWEFCLAEWSAQFLGDRVYRITEMEKENIRWEAEKLREGRLWHRWDYPHNLNSKVFEDRYEIAGMYTEDNWRAFRTWGMSANSPWQHGSFWVPRDGVDRAREELAVDWEGMQRPGFSADYIDERYERMDLAFEPDDWIPTATADALYRNNLPLLAYIAGKPDRFTSKDHSFYPGETVEKQIVAINNSREVVTAECEWSSSLPGSEAGRASVAVPTGDQERIPIRFELPFDLAPGNRELNATITFSTGEVQRDTFEIQVLARKPARKPETTIALYDPRGETETLLESLGISFEPVGCETDLKPFEVLVIGKEALTLDGPGPDLSRVPEGLKAVVFEQTPEVLEKRLGFRVTEYGLRNVFRRIPDHPLLAGLDEDHLRDWRGEATILPARLSYEIGEKGTPSVEWCGIEVTRAWRCGNHGNVASVLIEKPARGDFLPVVDGGYSLQYSPLMEYREGQGVVLFCQMDVTGRTERDPAAEILARNIIEYVDGWEPPEQRKVMYVGGTEGKDYLRSAGVPAERHEGGPIGEDQLLVVAPGGEGVETQHRETIRSWIEAGGHALAVGLDEAEANTFLPFEVAMERGEHIGVWFESAGLGSPLTGIGPADVHNRDPRELPLVTGGATAVGNGVLATAGEANVVFCQLAPWQFRPLTQMNIKRTFRRVAVLFSRLLGNMGASGSTPLLPRFASPVTSDEPEGRWLQGLYLDEPEEWDDPYRFFRW